MKEQGAGKIITVSSQAGRRASGDGGYAHYGTAKAAIIMYTKYLAQDLGPARHPGQLHRPRLHRHRSADADVRARRRRATRPAPSPRAASATPEDCARVVGFLAGPESDYVTGTVIPIDGGSTT